MIVLNPQSTQNNKFAIPLQYVKEKVKNEDDFLRADRRQGFFKSSVILGMRCQACLNYPE